MRSVWISKVTIALCLLSIIETAKTVPIIRKSQWQVNGLNYASMYCPFTLEQTTAAGDLKIKVTLDRDLSSFWDYNVFNGVSNGPRWYYRQSKYTYSAGQRVDYSFEIRWYGSASKPAGTCVVGSDLPTTATTQAATTKAEGPGSDMPTKVTSESTTTTTASNSGPVTFNYTEVIEKSMDFYAAQRSGVLPDNRIPWRGDSALGDSGDNYEDLTGGYYDAGDHVKFNFPMASSMTVLAWGQYIFGDAYEDFGQSTRMRETIKWGLDYLLKCWFPSTNTLYGQVGDGDIDHKYWGRPEEMTMSRPAYKLTPSSPGSDLAAETASALTTGYLVFKDIDQTYAKRLLDTAESIYNFADSYRGRYTDSIADAGAFYRSWNGYYDELMLASVLLYKATNKDTYKTKAASFFQHASGAAWAFSWDDKSPLAQLILYNITGDDQYKVPFDWFLKQYRGDVSNGPKLVEGVLAWRLEWGSLRYAANAAFMALLAADAGMDIQKNIDWAKSQIDFMLGKNSASRSYVVGMGNNPPQRPHHRSSSCPDLPAACGIDQLKSRDPNPQILYGALVGGPDSNGNYVDDRADYQKNEVACDYNAGFTSALAGLVHFRNLL